MAFQNDGLILPNLWGIPLGLGTSFQPTSIMNNEMG